MRGFFLENLTGHFRKILLAFFGANKGYKYCKVSFLNHIFTLHFLL
jgi:hypothetical protein